MEVRIQILVGLRPLRPLPSSKGLVQYVGRLHPDMSGSVLTCRQAGEVMLGGHRARRGLPREGRALTKQCPRGMGTVGVWGLGRQGSSLGSKESLGLP